MDLLEEPAALEEAVRNGKAIVAVYGAGRVGVTIAAAWLRAGSRVMLADIDSLKVDRIVRGEALFPDEPLIDQTFRSGFENGRLAVTDSPSQAAALAEVNIVAVPVGVKDGDADLGSVKSAFEAIGGRMRKGSLSVLETSVPPGTTRKVILPILEAARGWKAERDFGLAYSPERIFEGRSLKDLEENYPKVVSGAGPRSTEAVSKLYSLVAKKGVLTMSSLEAAEMEKLFEGVYRDVNIALANELAVVCEKLGLDYWEVSRASNSQPFSHLHRPGLGVGGACIPVYPVFVIATARKAGVRASLTELARSINTTSPKRVAGEIMKLMRVNGERKAAVLGLAFRGDVNDDRSSPTYDLLKELKRKKVEVVVHDPYVAKDAAEGYPVTSDLKKALEGCSLVVVCTDHRKYSELSYEDLVKLAGRGLTVYDARGVMDRTKFPSDRLVRLGSGHKPS